MMWRSSSFSGSGGNCVQVRGDLRALRDSKRLGAVLPVSRAAVAGLVAAVHQASRQMQ